MNNSKQNVIIGFLLGILLATGVAASRRPSEKGAFPRYSLSAYGSGEGGAHIAGVFVMDHETSNIYHVYAKDTPKHPGLGHGYLFSRGLTNLVSPGISTNAALSGDKGGISFFSGTTEFPANATLKVVGDALLQISPSATAIAYPLRDIHRASGVTP